MRRFVLAHSLVLLFASSFAPQAATAAQTPRTQGAGPPRGCISACTAPVTKP